MKEQDSEKVDVLQFIKELRKSDKCDWVFEGLSEEEIEWVERRTAERFRKTIPNILKLPEILGDPEKAKEFEKAMRQIIKNGVVNT